MPENINTTIVSDEELRLECIRFTIKNDCSHGAYNFPLYQMLEAQMLYQWIRTGILPIPGKKSSATMASDLLQKALDVLIEERKQSNQAAYSSDTDPNDLDIPESFLSRFLSVLRREKTTL